MEGIPEAHRPDGRPGMTPLLGERAAKVLEPTLVLSLATAILYYAGDLSLGMYYRFLGVPGGEVACSTNQCVIQGFRVALPVALLLGLFLWLGRRRRPLARRVGGNGLYFVPGGLFVLEGLLLLPGSLGGDASGLLLGLAELAAGFVFLRAGLRNVRKDRTWADEAKGAGGPRWRPWLVLAVGLYVLLNATAGFFAGQAAASVLGGSSAGLLGDGAPPVVFQLKTPDAAAHGRELRLVAHAGGKYYALDLAQGCGPQGGPAPGACLYVIPEDVVLLAERAFPMVEGRRAGPPRRARPGTVRRKRVSFSAGPRCAPAGQAAPCGDGAAVAGRASGSLHPTTPGRSRMVLKPLRRAHGLAESGCLPGFAWSPQASFSCARKPPQSQGRPPPRQPPEFLRPWTFPASAGPIPARPSAGAP